MTSRWNCRIVRIYTSDDVPLKSRSRHTHLADQLEQATVFCCCFGGLFVPPLLCLFFVFTPSSSFLTSTTVSSSTGIPELDRNRTLEQSARHLKLCHRASSSFFLRSKLLKSVSGSAFSENCYRGAFIFRLQGMSHSYAFPNLPVP